MHFSVYYFSPYEKVDKSILLYMVLSLSECLIKYEHYQSNGVVVRTLITLLAMVQNQIHPFSVQAT